MQQRQDRIRQLGIESGVIEDYVTHFWRDPSAAEQAAAMALLEAEKAKPIDKPPPAARRVAEAFAPKVERKPNPEDDPPIQDAVLTVSDQERLQSMDFEAMSAAEIEDIGGVKLSARNLGEVPPRDLPALLRSPEVVAALIVSLKANALANALILLIGTPAAYLLALRRFRGREIGRAHV